MKKIAIVGSSLSKWKMEQIPIVKETILDILKDCTRQYGEIIVVSGRSPKKGVDIWVEEIAEEYDIEAIIFPPGSNTSKAYGIRNHLISLECDILYCIDPTWRNWSGGQWTMSMARHMGKEVNLVLI